MKDWNRLEDQLRSWTPRSPSARLKARLFGTAEQVAAEPPSAFSGRWGWLAPVMGCFLAMMVLSSARSTQLGYMAATRTPDWLTTVTSNQSYAAYIVAGFHSGQNSLQKQSIEWTTGPRATAEPSSVSRLATNSLMH